MYITHNINVVEIYCDDHQVGFWRGIDLTTCLLYYPVLLLMKAFVAEFYCLINLLSATINSLLEAFLVITHKITDTSLGHTIMSLTRHWVIPLCH